MFDLETAISTWRHQFRHRRAFLPEDLDELERYLRDHIQHQVSEGVPPEAAFRRAVQAIGTPEDSEAEYRKVYWDKLRRQQKLGNEVYWRLGMLKNYAKIALRNLRNQSAYTAINVLGLALGLGCCLLIFTYLYDELTFDRFHTQADRIYRVERESRLPGNQGRYSFTDGPTGPTMAEDLPEVVASTRLHRIEALISAGQRQFFGEQVAYVDAAFFDIFSFPLLNGDPESALAVPNSIVISETMARKYFGTQDPVGRALRLDNTEDYTVTGVVADVPHNSHLRFDALASFSTLLPDAPWLSQWGSISVRTYVLLSPGATQAEVERKLIAFNARHRGAENQEVIYLRPLERIHLYSDVWEIDPQGDIQAIYLFASIAFFILLLACINYMNLATARSTRRMREVGMRKVLGAHRRQLTAQFLGESALLAFLALVIAVLMTYAGLPLLAEYVDRPLDTTGLTDGLNPVFLVLGTLSIGILSGLYPALYLTRHQPAHILKGTFQAGHRGAVLRKLLVVTQFLVSIVLLAATAVVFRQLRYMQNKHLGFDREQVVNIEVRDAQLLGRMELLQSELVRLPGVVNATVSSSGVGDFMRSTIMGPSTPEDAPNRIMTGFIFADPEYLPTLGMALVAGRNFSRELAPVAGTDVIINETAARRYGWTNPEEAIGEHLTENSWFDGGTVVGVIRDFNIRSLRSGIPPALIAWAQLADDAVVSVRIRPGNVEETLAAMEDRWDALVPDWPFEYAFLDAELDRLHRQDRQTGKLFGIFATLAVLIACLGLFGLAAFAAEQRTKEVGVRKVMGATEAQVVLLLSKEFTVLVLVAFVLAAPLIYFTMNRWLNEFAFRTDLSWLVFAFAGLTALLVAFLTVSYQAIKAARTNPVQALRHE